ncbi:MAG TPA: SDR family NAD(P)-dependent oxidoreductase [Ramlibacter sp.]|nr:SDR family NAD(P)-dependent oxidoreductase [Ramlibacter sp.]
MKLDNRTALITGAASGIGRATAQAYAQAGARVILADIDEAGGAKAAAELRAAGHNADYINVDMTNPASIEAFAAKVLQGYGAPDVIVNGAGWGKNHPFVEGTPDLWNKMIALNFVGPMQLVKAFLPAMIERKSGKIVNVSSDAGRVGSLGETVYSGAKGGLIAFTKSLAREVSRYQINVNCVCPGPTDTPLMAVVPDKVKDALTKAIPFRRLGKPEEVADAILFFGSDRASYITGQVLSVSGGLTMAG